MTAPRLEDVLTALEDERAAADRRYNEALTALDRAMAPPPWVPEGPGAFDDSRLPAINDTWKILPTGAPDAGAGVRGRLRGFIWRLVGPAIESQQRFNGAIVDHLNRTVEWHRRTERATADLIAAFDAHLRATVHTQAHLIQYLQTMTGYVDTRDRATGGRADIVNAAVSALSDEWLKRWESLSAREQRFMARAAAIDDLRATVTLAQQTSLTLKREVERLLARSAPAASAAAATRATPPTISSDRPAEAAAHANPVSADEAAASTLAADRADLDAYKYLGFEDAFRGSRDEIRSRLTGYVPYFAGASNVLDIGCGRGEFLDLLRAQGITGRGVDLNHEMVETARARGLEVAEGDALGHVQSLADGSLDGVFAAQVVEHLDPAYLMALIEAIFHKLRPGGVVILETINAACWLAFFESYIRDLTHVRAIHPETLQYLLRVSGFHDVQIEFQSPVPEAARLQLVARPPAESAPLVAQLIETVNENAEKLNARIFTYQDYAAIGTK